MAVLEKIRTKGGWLILILISVALLAFIIDPQSLQYVSNMFSKKNDVGNINGNRITAMDFQKRVEHYTQVNQMLYGNASSEEMNDQAKEFAWNDYIGEYVLTPQYKKIGIGVSDEEMQDLAAGQHLSPIIMQSNFVDQNTGKVNYENLDAFWKNESRNPEQQTLINYFENNIRQLRQTEKYGALIAGSNYINSLQVKSGVALRSTNSEFSYVLSRYNTNDSIAITPSEIEKYYNENKKRFEQTESRSVDYVIFSVLPSEEDIAESKNAMEEEYKQFQQSENPLQYAKLHSDKKVSEKFYKRSELTADLDSFAFAASRGALLPLYLDGYTYKTVRVNDIRELPDSVKVRHIIIPYTEQTQANVNATKAKADSICKVLRNGNGANFSEIAAAYKIPGDNSSESVWLPYIESNPLIDSCILNPTGKIMQLATQGGVLIFQVTEKSAPVKKVQLAIFEKDVIPSDKTVGEIHNTANAIAAASDKNRDMFLKIAKEKGLTPQSETNVQRAAKRFANYDAARELIRWIYDAELNEVSNVIDINNGKQFVVAAVNKINEDGIAPVTDPEVKTYIEVALRRQKQQEAGAAKMKEVLGTSTSISDLASKLNESVQAVTEGVNFSTNSIAGLGVEPKLVAAVEASDDNKLSGPVAGDLGVYAFVVTGRQTDQGYTPELEKQRLENIANNSVYNFYQILLKAAKIKDVRAKFF